jgi:hypothetical protein
MDLKPDDMELLLHFGRQEPPEHVDPNIFAKLLSMALVEQKEGRGGSVCLNSY